MNCAVDCKMVEITDWGDCSAPCGPGQRSRILLIKQAHLHGGTPCRDNDGRVIEVKQSGRHYVTDKKGCNDRDCPGEFFFSCPEQLNR
jgi:hypothetical protein